MCQRGYGSDNLYSWSVGGVSWSGPHTDFVPKLRTATALRPLWRTNIGEYTRACVRAAGVALVTVVLMRPTHRSRSLQNGCEIDAKRQWTLEANINIGPGTDNGK